MIVEHHPQREDRSRRCGKGALGAIVRSDVRLRGTMSPRARERREDRAIRHPSSGLLRAFFVLLVVAILTVGHIYAFRLSRPGRFPRDVIPHAIPGAIALALGAWLAAAAARAQGFKPRHVSLMAGVGLVSASSAGLLGIEAREAVVDLTASPQVLAWAVAHFVGTVAMLVGGFRILRKEFLDRIPRDGQGGLQLDEQAHRMAGTPHHGRR